MYTSVKSRPESIPPNGGYFNLVTRGEGVDTDTKSYMRIHNLATDFLEKNKKLRKLVLVLLVTAVLTGSAGLYYSSYQVFNAYTKYAAGEFYISSLDREPYPQELNRLSGLKGYVTRQKNQYRPMMIGSLILLVVGAGGIYFYKKF